MNLSERVDLAIITLDQQVVSITNQRVDSPIHQKISASISNVSDVVSSFELEISGLPNDSWYAISERIVRIFPNERDTRTLTICPPLDAPAAEYPFTVQVRRTEDKILCGEARCKLIILPEIAFGISMEPQKRTGREGDFRLKITNKSNVSLAVELSGHDSEDVLEFDFDKTVVELQPVRQIGSQAVTPFKVKVRKLHLVGKDQSHAFTIAGRLSADSLTDRWAEDLAEYERDTPGELIHKAILRSWRGPVLALLLALAVVVIAGRLWERVPWCSVPGINGLLCPAPEIANFSQDPDSVTLGERVTLAWQVANFRQGTTVTINKTAVPLDSDGYGELEYVPTRVPETKYELCVRAPDNPIRKCQAISVYVAAPSTTPTSQPTASSGERSVATATQTQGSESSAGSGAGEGGDSTLTMATPSPAMTPIPIPTPSPSPPINPSPTEAPKVVPTSTTAPTNTSQPTSTSTATPLPEQEQDDSSSHGTPPPAVTHVARPPDPPTNTPRPPDPPTNTPRPPDPPTNTPRPPEPPTNTPRPPDPPTNTPRPPDPPTNTPQPPPETNTPRVVEEPTEPPEEATNTPRPPVEATDTAEPVSEETNTPRPEVTNTPRP